VIEERPCPLKKGFRCGYTNRLALQSSCKGCPYAPIEIKGIMPGQQGVPA